jgi:enoyl-CoA hydratase
LAIQDRQRSRHPLQSPGRTYAISTKMGDEIVDLFTRINADPATWRCMVLTGSVDRVLRRRRPQGASRHVGRIWNKQHALFECMMLGMLDCPLPIIAAANGAATQAASNLCCCATLPTPYRRRVCSHGGHDRDHAWWRRHTDPTTGHRLCSRGRNHPDRRAVDAEQAFEWDVVNRLCAPGRSMDDALTTAGKIARNAPLSIRQAKRSMTLGAHGSPLRDVLRNQRPQSTRRYPGPPKGSYHSMEKRAPLLEGR